MRLNAVDERKELPMHQVARVAGKGADGVSVPEVHPPHRSFRQAARDLIFLCRPWQWGKNCFILAPLLFTPAAWDLSGIVAAILATACFCLWSSSVYCFNDILDAHADAQHPRKRLRPVASGRVPFALASALSVALAAGSLAAGFLLLPGSFVLYGCLYLANSLAYCLVVKHRVIVDVMSIAIGFVLRLLAGSAAIGVSPSSWLQICGFSLAMLLGFGKRRLELAGLEKPAEYRLTLKSYDASKLNVLLSIAASICLLSYMLYTVSPQTVALHHTDKLVLTVPFVAYGIFRYIFKVQEGPYDGPVEVFLKDPVFAMTGLLWFLAVVFLLSLGNSF